VLFLSTTYSSKGQQRTDRKRKKPSNEGTRSQPIEQVFGDAPSKVISIPTVAAVYNDEMNYANRSDQLRSYKTYDQRHSSGPFSLILPLLIVIFYC
jgi:hypothetical protein